MTSPLERAMRDWLRAGSEGLDGGVRSRLNRARQRALDELPTPARHRFRPALPLTAAAGGALLALAFGFLPVSSPRDAPAAVVIDDADLLPSAGEGLLDEDPTLFVLASLEESPR